MERKEVSNVACSLWYCKYIVLSFRCLLFLPFVDSLSYRFRYILKAATSPTKRLEEDSLTYLNQGNPFYYNSSMHILRTVLHTFPNMLIRRIYLTIKSFSSQ